MLPQDPARGSPQGDTFEVHRRTPFTQVPNELLLNPNLSLKAKGLLALMLSRPNGWVFRRNWITKQSKDGRDATSAALRELEAHGYLTYVQHHAPDGRFMGRKYSVYDAPRAANGKPVNGKPVNGRPDNGRPDNGQPAANKNEGNKTEEIEMESSSRAAQDSDAPTPLPETETTAPRELEDTLQGHTPHTCLQHLFGPLYASLIDDNPHRREAWAALDTEQIERARQIANAKAAASGETRAFRTLLKLKLDALSNATPPTPTPTLPGTNQASHAALIEDLVATYDAERHEHEQELWRNLSEQDRDQLEAGLENQLNTFNRTRLAQHGWTPDLLSSAHKSALLAHGSLAYPPHLTTIGYYLDSAHAPQWYSQLPNDTRTRIRSALIAATP